jgi:hypothetical protein
MAQVMKYYNYSIKGEGFAILTKLENGYLLDNRGINVNVAFTSFKYKEYAAMETAPSIDQLLESIIDKDPLVELYDCKSQRKIKNDLSKINKLVKQNFKKCVQLK